MINFITPCNHTESSLTASTPEAMVLKAVKLGLPYFAVTDSGHFSSIIKVYNYAKKQNIKPIAGIELYFYDKNCPIIEGTEVQGVRYFKIAIHFIDQIAYQETIKILSKQKQQITISGTKYPLVDWKDIEAISKLNVTACTTNLEDMVSKHLIVKRADLGVKYFEKLLSLFENRLYLSIVPYCYDKYWSSLVEFKLGEEQHKIRLPINNLVECEEYKEYKDSSKNKWVKIGKTQTIWQLIRFNKTKKRLTAFYMNNIRYSIKKEYQDIISWEQVQDFHSFGDGDIQLAANKFIIALAVKYNMMEKLLINSYSYYANEDDKIVQDMKMGQSDRIPHAQYMAATEDVLPYLKKVLTNDQIQQAIDNSYEWSERFKDFTLNYNYRLPEVEGDPVKILIDQIKKKGRMKWDDPRWVQQFKEEFQLLTENGKINLIPYFLPLIDVYDYYDENKLLTGPARGCLTSDTLVYTIEGIKKLSDISIGDKVLSHTGHWREVFKTMSYPVKNEALLTIKSQYSYQPNTMTKDHKVYAIKREKIKETNNGKERVWGDWNEKQVCWYRADELQIGDLVFTPKPHLRTVKDIDRFDLLPFFPNHDVVDDKIIIKKPKYNNLSCRNLARQTGFVKSTVSKLKHRKKVKLSTYRKIRASLKAHNMSVRDWIECDNTNTLHVDRFITLDERFCKFLGRWIGDGWLTSRNNSFSLCFHSDNIVDQKYYTDILTEMGWDVYKHTASNKKVTQYTIKNTCFGNFFKYIFPQYNYTSNTKHLSFLKYLPDEKLIWVLKGLIEADGHITRPPRGTGRPKENIDTTSKTLLRDLKEVFLFLNIPCAVQTRKPHTTKDNYLCKQSYKIVFRGIFTKRTKSFNYIVNDGYFSPITSIETKSADTVYDISVEKDHSYTTVDYAVHNSAGGFLISYLLGITHVNPIKYELHSSRFLTLDRVLSGNLPDIDCDLPTRVPLVGKDGSSGFLFKKYGDKAAQVSTRTMLRIKSAILDANRFINGGSVEDSIQRLSKSLPTTPQGVNDHDFVFGYEDAQGNHVDGLIDQNADLQEYAKKRPNEWAIVEKALSLARQSSRHACFAGDTLVNELGKATKIKNSPKYAHGKQITTWNSGVKPTIIVSFNNGISIQCTPDHKFMVGTKEVEAQDLIGESISYQPFTLNPSGKSYDPDFAFTLGWFLNDGAYISSVDRFEFYFTPDKDDEPKSIVLKWLKKNGYKSTQAKDRRCTYRSYHLPEEFKEMKANTPDKRLPDFFWKMDIHSQSNFMRGLFSANGYCLLTRPIVGIKLTSKLLISDISLWLHALNIETSCGFSKPKEVKHHNGTYISKSTATLTIPHYSNKSIFREKIGFEQTYKAQRLSEIIDNSINTSYCKKSIKCLAIEDATTEYVYDFNEPLENVGYINGVLVHNCAFLISDVPVEHVLPTTEIGGVKRVTQFTHKDCEAVGMIKYDFLVVSALKDINLTLKYIAQKNNTEYKTGYFNQNDTQRYVWDLPEDPKVFKMLQNGDTETVFQLNSSTATNLVKDIKPESVMDCAVITSLGRPGPLDFKDEKTGRNMAEEYAFRKRGDSVGEIEILNEMLPETYGILCFQEQVSKLAKELAGMNVEDSENVRIAVGKKKKDLIDSLKPVFIEGASKKVDKDTAEKVWDMMETFARYGFNKCVSGDTALLRNKNGNKSVTVEEMYKAKNDKDWAKQNNKESLGKKYRLFGYGKSYSMKDGKIHPNNIVDIRYEGKREVYKITTESGKYIKTTDNHKFPTPDGKKIAKDLKLNDLLYVNEGYAQDDTVFRYGGVGNLPTKGQQGFQKNPESSFSLFKDRSNHIKDTKHNCEICQKNLQHKRKEIHHKDGDHGNQDWNNLMLCCASCHKKEHYKMGRIKYGEKGLQCGTEKIISIDYVGIENVYDIEMEAPHHNFVTDTGVVTCNSHAVAYSVISYACAYLKYYHPLEWWAAVISNADDKEIREVFYKYIKDIIIPPDINKSTEEIVIDYEQNKILQKLSVLSGLGEASSNKLIKNRPYTDIKDFAKKGACGVSLAKKIIHVGVLDSLFSPKDSLIEKITKYTKALDEVEFEKKIEEIKKLIENTDGNVKKRHESRLNKLLEQGVKETIVDVDYFNMTPKQDYLMKKATYPTMSLDLHSVLNKDHKIPWIQPNKQNQFTTIINKYKKGTPLMMAETLEIIDKSILDKPAYICVPGYVIDAKEQAFKGGKKFLKLIIDSSGYIAERVIWPDYDTGELNYPKDLAKGAIAYFFYSKRELSDKIKIFDVIIENPPIKT